MLFENSQNHRILLQVYRNTPTTLIGRECGQIVCMAKENTTRDANTLRKFGLGCLLNYLGMLYTGEAKSQLAESMWVIFSFAQTYTAKHFGLFLTHLVP